MHLKQKILAKNQKQGGVEGGSAQTVVGAMTPAPLPQFSAPTAAQEPVPAPKSPKNQTPAEVAEPISSRYEQHRSYNSSQEFAKFTTECFPQAQMTNGLPLPLGVFIKPLGSQVCSTDSRIAGRQPYSSQTKTDRSRRYPPLRFLQGLRQPFHRIPRRRKKIPVQYL